MKTLRTTSNIFDLPTDRTHAVCITTNGMIKRNGTAVMGAGIAKEANERFHLGYELANHLKNNGNTPFIFSTPGKNNSHLISFPTKYDWRNQSDLNLIRRSAEILVEICNNSNIQTCYLTPPGCGCGGLNWDIQVKPVIESILDDRFTIVFRQ